MCVCKFVYVYVYVWVRVRVYEGVRVRVFMCLDCICGVCLHVKVFGREKAGSGGMRWGSFAAQVPGRVGYQCSNYYLHLERLGCAGPLPRATTPHGTTPHGTTPDGTTALVSTLVADPHTLATTPPATFKAVPAHIHDTASAPALILAPLPPATASAASLVKHTGAGVGSGHLEGRNVEGGGGAMTSRSASSSVMLTAVSSSGPDGVGALVSTASHALVAPPQPPAFAGVKVVTSAVAAPQAPVMCGNNDKEERASLDARIGGGVRIVTAAVSGSCGDDTNYLPGHGAANPKRPRLTLPL